MSIWMKAATMSIWMKAADDMYEEVLEHMDM